MKLPVPFIQLPLLFDVAALAAEIALFDESLWQPHPSAMPGNSALPLITVDGDPARGDALEGPMRATPSLRASPYMQRALASLDAVLGRTRLMRLSGRAEVEEHVDLDYYWSERVRVHIPILTQPSVRFYCGDAQVNMAAGECWIFDTWRMHRVLNDADLPRIHLVIDTVGGAAFWNLVNAGRPHTATKEGWRSRLIAPEPASPAPPALFESINSQSPMSYWELRSHLMFLLGEVEPQPRMQAVAQVCSGFMMQWQTLWFAHGTDTAAQPQFRALLEGFTAQIDQVANGIRLRNGVDFPAAMKGLLRRAVQRPDIAPATEEGSRSAPARSAPHA
jgi:hypothetical protein